MGVGMTRGAVTGVGKTGVTLGIGIGCGITGVGKTRGVVTGIGNTGVTRGRALGLTAAGAGITGRNGCFTGAATFKVP